MTAIAGEGSAPRDAGDVPGASGGGSRLIRRVGDRGLLLDLADNDAVHRVAAVARERFGDVLAEVVAGHRTVLLAWAAPPADVAVAEEVLGVAAEATDVIGAETSRRPAGGASARVGPEASGGVDEAEALTVPVVYDGPDLSAVAARCGFSVEEVVRRHSAATYRVAFVGFAPGFGYLVGGDPALRVPRRDDPRERVPAGSVAIAGEYSAVYPGPSPGGWQLLGRTELRMFDPARQPPALLEPGRLVRFVPEGGA
jgi:allophanate hydrolase subunit 1